MKTIRLVATLFLLGFFCLSSHAQFSGSSFSIDAGSQFLPVEQAFQASLTRESGQWQMYWSIEPGYYLYLEQFEFQLPGAVPVDASFPTGETKFDEFFDRELEVFYNQLTIGLQSQGLQQETPFFARFQGCADAGYCYPPEWIAFELLPALNSAGNLGLVEAPALAGNSTTATASTDTDEADALPITLILGFGMGLALLAIVIRVSIRNAKRKA